MLGSCNPNPGLGTESQTATGGGDSGQGSLADERPHILDNVTIANDQLILDGDRFLNVVSIRVTDGVDFNESLDIESLSKQRIVANFQRAVKFLVGSAISLIITDAAGAATYAVTVQLGSGSGLNNLGTWDATANDPTLSDNGTGPVTPSAGDYYIISTAGSTTIDGNSTWSAGDWILYDAALDKWKRIEISNTVSTVFGRSGAVVATTNDYTWAQIDKGTSPIGDLSNVSSTAPTTDQALVWDGSEWLPTDVLLSDGNTVSESDLADNSVTLAKLYHPPTGSIWIGSGSGPVELDIKTSGQIIVGNSTTATSVAVSGDATLASDGSLTIANSAVETAMINNDAVDRTKLYDITNGSILIGTAGDPAELAAGTSGNILVSDGTTLASVSMSGDATLASDGTLSLATGVITSSDIEDDTIVDDDVNSSANITATKLGTGIVDNTEFNYLDGLSEPISTTLGNRVNKAGDTMTGNLAMGTNDITGTGEVEAGTFTSSSQSGIVLDDTGSVAGELRFMEVGAGTNYMAFKAPTSITTSRTLTLPDGAGTNGQVLTTNGTDTLSWVTILGPGDTAGGELTGTYPNPNIDDNVIDSANIINGSIVNDDINASAAIARSKIASGTASWVLVNDGSGNMSEVANLTIAQGGTGSTTDTAARVNLGLEIGADVQEWDTDLDTIAAMTSTADSTFIVGSPLGWVVENATEARDSLGLGTGNSPTFTGLRLSSLTGVCTVEADGLGNLNCSSDARLKNIKNDFQRGLKHILEINPKVYQWNELSGLDGSHDNAGFIAQNVEENIPEAVGVDKRGYLTLSLTPIVAALVNATKEQQQEIEFNRNLYKIMQGHWSEQERVIASLQNQIEIMDQKLEEQDKRIQQLEELIKKLVP